MKSIGVIYATREGHTARIAERVAAGLHSLGFTAGLFNLQDEEPLIDLSSCDGVVLAASVHAGKHESEMAAFVRKHRVRLEALPTAFLSVTLSEAGAERPNTTAEEHARFQADVQSVIDTFLKDTGWHPGHVKPVAGALQYSKYNIFIRFIMKHIAKKAGGDTDTSRDYDYTNWADLDAFVRRLAEELKEADRASGKSDAHPQGD